VFVLPWEGHTMVGTTDVDHGEDLAQEPGITRAEFDYLLQAVRAQFPSLRIVEDDVLSTWSGVRPVVASGKAVDPSKEAREHLVVEEEGLVTLTGGKLTTFRSSAVQALRLAAPRVAVLAKVGESARVFAPVPTAVAASLRGLPPALKERWLSRFGPQAAAVNACALEGERDTIAHTGIAWAELRWACRHEQVVRLDDLLLRRTRLGLLMSRGGAEALPRVRRILQQELRWNDERWNDEVQRYEAIVARCHAMPKAREGRDP
jgi:glycerol-3-phosphate dehydrogenase